MPLDPNRFDQKRSGGRQAALVAVESSAIILTSMLAVLFLSWAIALRLPIQSESITAERVSGSAGGASSVTLSGTERTFQDVRPLSALGG
jgi:hypothetical protein